MLGTMTAAIGLVGWVILCAVVVRMVAADVRIPATFFWYIVALIAVIAAVGGLFSFWSFCGAVEFWKRGYRIRQMKRHGYFRWSLGPQECVYEERTQDGSVQTLPFVRVVIADGYPAPCEVALPKEEDWNSQTPDWAWGRREEIINRMIVCFGGAKSATRLVDLP